MLTCTLPLNEILVDFNDKLKSITRGYGSMDYEHDGFRPEKLVKMEMLINGDPVDAFATIVHRDKAENRGRVLAKKLAAARLRAISGASGDPAMASFLPSVMRRPCRRGWPRANGYARAEWD